jgi:hypothetical protein
VDEKTREHTDVRFNFLKHEISDAITAYEDYIHNKVITFDHLWMIFQPGCIVISGQYGPQSAFELDRSQYHEERSGCFLRLHCSYIDWSGETFGRGETEIDVPEFQGTKNIPALRAFPLRFLHGNLAVEAGLIERGKKFESLAGHHFKA